MKRFVPITRKINAIIIISLVVGIGIIIVYFAYNQNLTLRNTTYESLNQQSDILYQSIENAMLPGAAFIVTVIVLALVLTQFLQKTVIKPVKHVGDVCAQVTRGNFAEMTLFFSDIRSFTAFSEKNSPEAVVDSLNKILNFQTEIIHKCGGDVDKYVGDEIVAIFSGDEKEAHACLAALKIQIEIRQNKDLYRGLALGIGINTGEVILGQIGSERRADFTIIGDHVNLASRLCDVAKAGMIYISDSTYQRVESLAQTKGPLKLLVKGKEGFQWVHLLSGMKKKET